MELVLAGAWVVLGLAVVRNIQILTAEKRPSRARSSGDGDE